MEQREEYKTLVNDVKKLRGDVDSAEKSFTNKKDQFDVLDKHVKILEEHLGLLNNINQEAEEQRKREQEANERDRIEQERKAQEEERKKAQEEQRKKEQEAAEQRKKAEEEQRQREQEAEAERQREQEAEAERQRIEQERKVQEQRKREQQEREKALAELAKSREKRLNDEKKAKELLQKAIISHNKYVQNSQWYNPGRSWYEFGSQLFNGIDDLFVKYIKDLIALINESEKNIYIQQLNTNEEDYKNYMYLKNEYNEYIHVQMLIRDAVEEAFINKAKEIPIAIKILSSIRYKVLKDHIDYFRNILLYISSANLHDCKDIDMISKELARVQANIRVRKPENWKSKDELMIYIFNLVHYYQRRCGERRGGRRKTKKPKRNGRNRTTRRA
jgi:chemotaxis protein histidine kinase CheA